MVRSSAARIRPRQCQSRSKEWQKRSRRPSRTVRNPSIWPCPIRLRAGTVRRHGRLRLAAGHGPGLPARGDRVHRARRRGPDALARPLRDRAGGRRGRRVHVRQASAARRSPATSSSSTTASRTSPSRTRAGRCGCCWCCSARSSSPGPAAGRWTRATSRRSAGTSGRPRPRVRGGTPAGRRDRPLLHRLRDIHVRRDPAERFLADATLRTAIALVNRDPAARATPGAVRAAADRREQIRPVLAYVDRNHREQITLEDVAGLVHVSPSRVRHVFKDVTGVSFKEYVTQVRVAEAKRLLLSTDLSVAEIARAVSYTNLHQFYKVFYRSCAMSPGRVPPLLHARRRRSGGGPAPGCRARRSWRDASWFRRAWGSDPRGGRCGLGGGRAHLLRGVRHAGRPARLPARLPHGRGRVRAHPLADQPPPGLRRGGGDGRPGPRARTSSTSAAPSSAIGPDQRGPRGPGPPRRPDAHGGDARARPRARRPGRPPRSRSPTTTGR